MAIGNVKILITGADGFIGSHLTKAAGKLRVQEVNPDALVIRTNFYGWAQAFDNLLVIGF